MKLIFLLAVFALSGCTSISDTVSDVFTPDTPQEIVYTAKVSYAASLKVAVAYESLPRCEAPAAPVLCSRASVVATMRSVDDSVSSALDAAETTARTPGLSDDVYEAVAKSAKVAAAAFAEVANSH